MFVTWLLTPKCFELSMLSSFNQMACVQMLAARWCCGFSGQRQPRQMNIDCVWGIYFALPGARYVGDRAGERVECLCIRLQVVQITLQRMVPGNGFICQIVPVQVLQSNCVEHKRKFGFEDFSRMCCRVMPSSLLARKMARCQGVMWIIARSSGVVWD